MVLGRRDIEINFDIIREESKFDNLTFNLMKMMFTKKFIMKLLLIHLLLVPVFPAVLILQGLISLFHPGKINQITGDWGFSGSL